MTYDEAFNLAQDLEATGCESQNDAEAECYWSLADAVINHYGIIDWELGLCR
jgi:hypothetical protein